MHLRIGTKIGSVFILFFISIILSMSIYSYFARHYEYYTKELQMGIKKLNLLKDLERGLIQIIFPAEDLHTKKSTFLQISTDIEEIIDNLYRLEINNIEERKLLNYVTEKYAKLKKIAFEIFKILEHLDNKQKKEFITKIEDSASQTLTIAEKFHEVVYEEINKLQALQNKTKYLMYIVISSGILLNILLIIGSLLFFKRTIILPLISLRNTAREIGKGDLDKKVAIKSKDEIGELASAFNIMVKDLKNTQSKLIQTEKLASVGQLAAGVAHEIKNPLSIITLGIEFVRSSLSNTSLIDALEKIKKATLHADKIVKDLLDFSQQTPPLFRSTDILTLLEETLSLIQYQTNIAQIKIEKEFGSDLPKVKIDSNQMKQVFLNIIFNAIDAMPEGGTIKITTKKVQEKDSFLQIIFSDTGYGISKENLQKVFDPFYTTKKKKGSAGLGLAVSKGIVERHHGMIEIQSEVGKGSSVIIKLPLYKKGGEDEKENTDNR